MPEDNHEHHWDISPETVIKDGPFFHQCSCGLVLSRDCRVQLIVQEEE